MGINMAKKSSTEQVTDTPVSTDLAVNYRTTSWVTRERNPDDEWDRDNTASEHTLQSIMIAGQPGYSTLAYPGKVLPGEKVYLVYAVYSTGDSFGHDEDRCVELVSVHKNIDVARANLELIKNSHSNDYTHQLVLSQDNGQTWKISPPWCGYFETLYGAEIIEDDDSMKFKV